MNQKTRKDETDSLDGLTVLFLPKNSRTAYFTAFLRKARQRHGWSITVTSPGDGERVWREAIGPSGTHVAIPDFTARQAWEDEDAFCDDLDSFIWQCERDHATSAGRIVLAGERDLGRGFSLPAYHWFANNTAKRVLADTDEPFRIVRRMMKFVREVLLETKPDLVLAGEWADPLCFAFSLAARQMGILCVVNRPSKIWSGRCYWTTDPLMYNEDTPNRFREMTKSGADISKRARSRLSEFREAPETLGYVQSNWRVSEDRGWFARHGDLTRLLAVDLQHRFGKRPGPPAKPALGVVVDHYRKPWLKFRQKRFFSSLAEQELAGMKYLYLALHKDPEQALNYQAPFWSNQINTITLISSSLPDGYRLLVREHRLNAGRRPTRFYKEMRTIPGVILIDAFDDQFKYISNADLVVTDNGSTGWEGLMLGRRVITLAENFYSAAGLDTRLREPEELSASVIALLDEAAVADSEAHDKALGWLMDAEWETTAPIEGDGSSGSLKLLARLVVRHTARTGRAKREFA